MKKEPKRKPSRTLRNFQIVGKFSDGKYRQIALTKEAQREIVDLLVQMDGVITVFEEPLTTLTWESEVNLSVK